MATEELDTVKEEGGGGGTKFHLCVGEVVVVWQMDEETTADSRSLLSLLPASSLSLARCSSPSSTND